MELLISWLILTVAVLITAQVLPGFRVHRFGDALVVAALVGILNLLLGWFFFVVIGFATLGLGFLLAFLTRLVADALVLKLVDALTTRLTIRSFGTAFLAALLMSALGTAMEWLVGHSYAL